MRSTVTALALVAVAATPCPLKSTTRIAVYADESGGVGPGSHAWTSAFFSWWAAANPGLQWVELSAEQVHTSCVLADFESLLLYVQPGGDAFNQSQSLGPNGRDNILNFLFSRPSARYMGTCAGAYYASGTYWWKGAYEGAFYFTPHLFPTVEGPIAAIADYPLYAPTTVTLADADATELTMLYYGGPASGLEHTTNAVPGKVLGRFTDVPGGIPTSVAYGQVLLHSPHPEAVAGVQLTCAPPLPPGCITSEQQLGNWRWLAAEINTFIGTEWVIPTALGRDGVNN